MRDELRMLIRTIHEVDEHLLDVFLSLWSPRIFEKEEFLSKAGNTDSRLYYIGSGFQKSYFYSNGREQIVSFSYGGQFTCNPESFLTQKPSKYDVKALSQIQVLNISANDFFGFLQEYPEFEVVIRKKLVRTLEGVVERYHRLLVLTMEERFLHMMSNSPHLLNHVSQKDLANYLRMDPTNFSKLINRIRL